MKQKISFHPESALGKCLYRWWHGLENNKGDRAELCRAHNLTAVVLTRAYQSFYQQMVKCGWPSEPSAFQNERLATIAGLLANVRYEDEQKRKFAEILSEGERPVFSELRFRRLLESSTNEELFVNLRRALPMVGRKATIEQFAESIFYWGDKVKKYWAYTYYGNARISA